MLPNWDDLRIFLAVARRSSLSAAAKSLRIDPATVGRRVARLEQSVGTPLFAKSPLGYALTQKGTQLLAAAEATEAAVLGANDVIDTQDAQRGGGLSGSIRLGAPDGCANFLLPQVCARIVRDNPDLDIQIVALPRVVNLSRREADMAITVSAPSAARLSVQKLCNYHLHLAGAESYLKQAPPVETVADLQHHPVIGYIPDMIFDKELDYLGDLGVTRLCIASNSVAVQFHAIRSGAGLGVVHDFALPTAPEVKRVLTQQVSLERSFYLVRHTDDRRLDRMNRFAGALARELRLEVARLEAGQTAAHAGQT